MEFETLSQEFERHKAQHVSFVIQLALQTFESQGIYNSYLIEPFDSKDEEPTVRSSKTMDNIVAYKEDSEDEEAVKTYNAIYNMCYNLVKSIIPDNEVVDKEE